jgi:hypothetical protein
MILTCHVCPKYGSLCNLVEKIEYFLQGIRASLAAPPYGLRWRLFFSPMEDAGCSISYGREKNSSRPPQYKWGVEELATARMIPAAGRPILATPLLMPTASRPIPATMLLMPAATPVPCRRASNFGEKRGCHGTLAPAWPLRAGLRAGRPLAGPGIAGPPCWSSSLRVRRERER